MGGAHCGALMNARLRIASPSPAPPMHAWGKCRLKKQTAMWRAPSLSSLVCRCKSQHGSSESASRPQKAVLKAVTEVSRAAGRIAQATNVEMGITAADGSGRGEWRLPDEKVEAFLDLIKWDSKGLAVAIAQHVDTGAVLMQGFVNREAVSVTLASHRATFFSRSRSQLWTKGETSSNFIQVEDVFLDCDRDSLIYLGKPDGPTCHTGAETCYFTSASERGLAKQAVPSARPLSTLFSLEATIADRKSELHLGTGSPSWTKKLLKNQELLCSKIREEADELCRTVEENETKDRTASEMADVLYHSMVLLSLQDVQIEEVLQILRARFSQSGLQEKESRKLKVDVTSTS